jgi:TPR repeat protein
MPYRSFVMLFPFFLVAISIVFPADLHAANKSEMRTIVKFLKKDDFSKAIAHIQPLADEGDAWAQEQLGYLYNVGKGVTKDYVQAKTWYEKSAKQLNNTSLIRLATLYYNGRGVEKDREKALRYYIAAAPFVSRSFTWVLRRLGFMYLEGNGTDKNTAIAAFWFKYAISFGDNKSKSQLAGLYYRGLGVPQHIAMSQALQKAAAEGGDKGALKLVAEAEEAGLDAAVSKLTEKELQKSSPKDLMHPFGLSLGESINRYSALYANESQDLNNEFFGELYYIRPPRPIRDEGVAKNADEPFAMYTAEITPVSGTLYRVVAERKYSSVTRCKQSLENYVDEFLNDTAANRVIWQVDEDGAFVFEVTNKSIVGEAVEHSYNGPKITDFQSLIGLEETHPKAVDLTIKCEGIGYGSVDFVHLPSLEYRIAESFQLDPFLMGNYAPTENKDHRSSIYSPFGVQLGEVLQNEIRMGHEFDDRHIKHDLRPPFSNEFFTEYGALTSHISERVFSVSGKGVFRDKEVCSRSINQALLLLVEATGAAQPKWYSREITGNDALDTHFEISAPDSPEEKVLVRAGCQSGKFQENGDESKWYGWAAISSDRAEEYARLEACTLNLQCGISGRDDIQIGLSYELMKEIISEF